MARASLETRLIVFSEMVSSKVLLFKVRIWKKEKYNMFYYIKELAAVFDRVSSTYHIPRTNPSRQSTAKHCCRKYFSQQLSTRYIVTYTQYHPTSGLMQILHFNWLRN